MKYWEVKMAAAKVGELLLYGSISNDQFWGDEITPKQIDAELKALGELDTLNVRINSPGGNVFAAQAIYSIIKRHPAATKNAYIDGLAASAATIVPYACDKVFAYSNAMMMIHKPFASVYGNADLMRQRADVLDKVEDTIVDGYEGKCKQPRDSIKAMLAAETWMTAKEAKDMGFIDEIEEGMQVAASLEGDVFVCGSVRVDLTKFKATDKLKEVYREAVKTPEPVADSDPSPDPELTKRLAAQAADCHRLRLKLYDMEES